MRSSIGLLASLALLWPLGACGSSAALPAGTTVGEVARDITGVDLDGVPFQLGDYAGKVVFLDFWGDW